MPKLPILSGDAVVKALTSKGYSMARQTGSHMILKRPSGGIIVVPRHKPMKRGTLRAILRQAGLTVDEFLRLL